MHLKCNHRRTFCHKRQLQKCRKSRFMKNLAKTPKTRIFRDFAKGGPRETTLKSRPYLGRLKNMPAQIAYFLISMHLKCTHRRTFCPKRQLQKCWKSRFMKNLARTLKLAFSEILQRGVEGNCKKKAVNRVLKNRPAQIASFLNY